MISLTRKAELLTKHAKAMEAFKEMADADYARQLNKIALDSLVGSRHISEEEKNWLLEQIEDKVLSEEELETRKAAELLYEILHHLISIDGVYEPAIVVEISPDFNGMLYNEDECATLFEFNSFEDCIEKMKNFLKEYQ